MAGTLLAFALVSLLAIGTADRAYASKKVALVIGNSAYQKAGALTNPKNDAAAVGALLKSAGFAVVVIRNDLDQRTFTRVLRSFSEHARNADMAVIFYAGHGIEVGGTNYLIPTDATIERDIDVQDETISLERLSASIEKAKRLRLIILDACRDNPFAEKIRSVVASRSFISRGLAKVEPPADTLIAFAAKAGSVAADGNEGNSPFTKALLKHLVTPGLDIRIALGKVRDEVFETTNEKQEPFVYGSLGGATMALVDPPKAEPPVKQAEPIVPPSPQRPVESLAAEAAVAWPLVASTTNCRHLEAFIKRFDTTFHAELARDRLEELNNCKKIATPAPQPSPKPQPAPPPQRAEEPQPQKPPEKKPGPIASADSQLKPERPKAAAPILPALCQPDRHISVGPAIGGALLQVRVQPNLSTAREFRAVAFSRDGTRFATAGDDHIVRLWDATNFQMIAELRGHSAEVYSVDFSADNKLLASTGFDGTVRLWDVRSGELQHIFRTESARGAVRQFGVAFYPGSGSSYVDSVGVDGQVWIWDVQRKRLDRKRASHTDSSDTVIRTISFSPRAEGEFMSGGFDGTIRQFLSNGRVQSLKAHTGKVLQIAYAPGGDRFASAGVDAGSPLKLWTTDRRLIRSLDGHKGYVVSIAWSKDGRLIASGGGAKDLTVRVWDVQSGRQLHLFTGHTADIEGVAFHPNGRWVLSVSEDKTIKVWSLATGKEILTLAAFEGAQYVAYVPNGCHTGSGEAQRFVRLVSKDEKGVERDLPDSQKRALLFPASALPALLQH